MRRRGFTLFEVVLVLALLIAVIALVGPALANRLAPMTFERAITQTESALRMAREEAQSRGVLVFLYAEIDREGSTELVSRRSLLEGAGGGSEMGMVGSHPQGARSTERHRGTESDQPTVGQQGDISDSSNERIVLTLPSKITLTPSPPSALSDENWEPGFSPEQPGFDLPQGVTRADPFESDSSLGGVGFGDDQDLQEPLLIAVFLADGSALPGQQVWLTDRERRSAKLVLHGPTGRATLVPHRSETGLDGAESSFEDDLAVPEVFEPERFRDRTSPAAMPESDDSVTDEPEGGP